MNDRTRTIELAALAAATDADGTIDFTRFEAQRLILQHQSIDGVDARGIVRQIEAAPAFTQEGGKEQARPLLEAIRGSLPADQRARFDAAVDDANHWDGVLERGWERAQAGAGDAYGYVKGKVDWADAQVSDSLAEHREWAQRASRNPENSYLQRAAANLAAAGVGEVQENYGALKGAASHGLSMLGETVDLAKFGYRFTTDTDFRNTMIGAAAVYAAEVSRDPSKPLDDLSNAARNAWNQWEKGLEQAQQQGKEREYLGSAQGAAGVELLTAIVPVTKVGTFAKVAKAVDVDLADGARLGGAAAREAGSEAAEALADLARSARNAQKVGGFGAEGADLLFHGLAGVRRSQGELRTLVTDMKAAGAIDGLLSSGALRPHELGYLARTDLQVFQAGVSFDQAITAYVGKRALTDLSTREIGDIGEAVTAHKLAQQGYRDLVPIQNNSGHGNDLVGINPGTGHWDVVEVKASARGIAKSQMGDPESSIFNRLRLAAESRERTVWAPKNMWEEQAQPTAARILKEIDEGKTIIEPKWARVNLELDANTGQIKAYPQIEKWLSPAERATQKGASLETPAPDVPSGMVQPGMSASFSPSLHNRPVGNTDAPQAAAASQQSQAADSSSNANQAALAAQQALHMQQVAQRAHEARELEQRERDEARKAEDKRGEPEEKLTDLDRTETGQWLNKFFAAAERGDEAAMSQLANEYAQTDQFKAWDQWGKDNYAQMQRDQEQQLAQQAEQSRGRSI